jgi:hypothetical protein
MPPGLMAGLARIALSRGDPIWIYLTCHDGLAACRGLLDHCAPAPQERAALLGDEERRTGIVSRQRTHQSRHRRRLGGGSRSIGLT